MPKQDHLRWAVCSQFAVPEREQMINFPRLCKIIQLFSQRKFVLDIWAFNSYRENQGLTSVDCRIVRKHRYASRRGNRQVVYLKDSVANDFSILTKSRKSCIHYTKSFNELELAISSESIVRLISLKSQNRNWCHRCKRNTCPTQTGILFHEKEI